MSRSAAARDGLAAGTAILLFYLLLPPLLGPLLPRGLLTASLICFLQPLGALGTAVLLRRSRRLPLLLRAPLPPWGLSRWAGMLGLLMVLLGLSAKGWEWLLDKLHFPSAEPASEMLVAHAPLLLYCCFGISAVLLAPLAEEVLFRDFFCRGLRTLVRPWTAAGISALVFAAMHFTLRQFLPLAVMGIFLQILVGRTRSLRPAILLHGLNNLLSFLLLSLASRW